MRRGTLSIGDVVTDLMCTPMNLGLAARQCDVKDGDKHYAHGGMFLVANRIRADIEKQQILHRLMNVAPETLEQQQKRESMRLETPEMLSEDDRAILLKATGRRKGDPLPEDFMYGTEVFMNDHELSQMDCSRYRLICCGHSLGSVSPVRSWSYSKRLTICFSSAWRRF